MKKRLMKMLADREARKLELGTKATATENIVELRGINVEIEALNLEMIELRASIDECKDENPEFRSDATIPTIPTGKLNPMATFATGSVVPAENRSAELTKTYETRGESLKAKKSVEFSIEELPELRATTIGGGTLVVPTVYSNSLNPTFQQISSVIDMVSSIPLNGGESYRKGFEISIADADVTTEVGAYNTADPVFGYVDIVKSKITAYAEITDEAMKMPNVNYQSYVASAVAKSLRKKIAKNIVTGAGGANTITGIFNAPVAVIPATSDLSIAAIDLDTLDTIVFGYGGDESMEGQATLILSKADLAAFAAVKDFEGEKYYQIKLNGATGTISSDGSFEVPFVLNSVCPALSAGATVAGTYCMAYGNLMNYEMPLFSSVTVEESRDFKFSTGQIAYRASVWIGGNVAAYKGFVKIKKG